jgi:hypothetical protein
MITFVEGVIEFKNVIARRSRGPDESEFRSLHFLATTLQGTKINLLHKKIDFDFLAKIG